MKKLIYILLFIPFITVGQITDDSLRSYNDTYIIENITNAISATMINTLYEDIIDSKVNVDSATTFRWSTNRDSAFVNWWGYSVDTLFFYVQDDNSADEDTIFISNDTAIYNKVNSNLTDGNGIVDFTYNGSTAATVEADTTVVASKAWVLSRDYGNYDTASWHTWTPTVTWTGTNPTVNNALYRFKNDGNTVHYQIYITFTTGIGAPTNLSITLPIAPADINNPIIPVQFLSKTGTAYAKNDYPYIDGADNTPANRLMTFGGGFSLVVETTYGWSMYGFYEISE